VHLAQADKERKVGIMNVTKIGINPQQNQQKKNSDPSFRMLANKTGAYFGEILEKPLFDSLYSKGMIKIGEDIFPNDGLIRGREYITTRAGSKNEMKLLKRIQKYVNGFSQDVVSVPNKQGRKAINELKGLNGYKDVKEWYSANVIGEG